MAQDELQSDLPIPPGEYLAEVLEDLAIDPVDIAELIEQPLETVYEILAGSRSISPDIAAQLERFLDVPAYIWLRLDEDYHAASRALQKLGGDK